MVEQVFRAVDWSLCLAVSLADPNIRANFKASPGHLEAEGMTTKTGERTMRLVSLEIKGVQKIDLRLSFILPIYTDIIKGKAWTLELISRSRI